jgi:SAM-dependent methyltransferase
MIIWYILAFILLLVAITELSTWRTGVPTVASFRPSRRKIIEALTKYSAAHTSPTPYTIIDLGSGNGQLASKVAKNLPQTEVTGIEISPVPWLLSYLRRAIFGPRNLKFLRVDFWPYDCSKTDAIIAYLTGPVITRVSEKLRKELKPGAIIITNEIPLQGDWKPLEIIETGFLKMKIYVYRQGD